MPPTARAKKFGRGCISGRERGYPCRPLSNFDDGLSRRPGLRSCRIRPVERNRSCERDHARWQWSPARHLPPIGERSDECIDLILIWTLASGIAARTCGVADPKHNLVRSRRVMDQHRGRIKGIEIPTLVEGPIDEINGRSRRAHLGVAWNDNATASDRATHRHAESR